MSRFRIIAFVAFALVLPGCVKLTLAWADLKPDGPAAAPRVLDAYGDAAPILDVKTWERDRMPVLKDTLQAQIYGYLPDSTQTKTFSRRVLDDAVFDGIGRLEEFRLEGRATFNGVERTTKAALEGAGGFYMNVIYPVGAARPAPIILMQTFCPRWDTIPHPGVTRPQGASSCLANSAMSGVVHYAFGRYIMTPPIKTILERGYAIATIYPGEFMPDRSEEGLAALAQLTAGHDAGATRLGAIGAWAWGYSMMVDALEASDLDISDYIAWGHSRYGKSALLAAAFDDRIGAVIAHQSGTGGASLNRQKKGESIGEITESYPHWFAPAYARYAEREERMAVDQHHLLALIAPRPVLLGNARRDVWSDPNGAFRAAVGADPVYELYGRAGLDQDRLDEWRPDADIAFWIRPGTHGVVKEDWPAFLEFLDAHFGEP